MKAGPTAGEMFREHQKLQEQVPPVFRDGSPAEYAVRIDPALVTRAEMTPQDAGATEEAFNAAFSLAGVPLSVFRGLLQSMMEAVARYNDCKSQDAMHGEWSKQQSMTAGKHSIRV